MYIERVLNISSVRPGVFVSAPLTDSQCHKSYRETWSTFTVVHNLPAPVAAINKPAAHRIRAASKHRTIRGRVFFTNKSSTFRTREQIFAAREFIYLVYESAVRMRYIGENNSKLEG